MTDFTTAQLGTIVSALTGKQRKPATKAGAIRAIGRHAASIGRTKEAVLVLAPGLLEGRLDPASWREQLTAPAEVADLDKHVELANGEGSPPPEPNRVAFRPGTKQELIAGLLGRDQGATLVELIAATGWLPHTARAALTGLRRKGCTLEKNSREDRKVVYRIVQPDKVVS